ncbi:MAG: hypothetical protein HXY34_05770 [Candidatus Thorarchaeota archaeon]|nr:hypothetical protein [Candidatus Thorarchaeota archaeon]
MSYENKPVEATVAQLRPRMSSVAVTFKVVEIGDEREVSSRSSGENHRVADAIVGDSTGTVRLPLWDDAIESVKLGDTYTLTNGYTGLFKGTLRLNIGKFGKITAARVSIDKVNTSVDMSAQQHDDTRPPRRDYRGSPNGSGSESGSRSANSRSGTGSGGGRPTSPSSRRSTGSDSWGYSASNRGSRGPPSRNDRGRRY